MTRLVGHSFDSRGNPLGKSRMTYCGITGRKVVSLLYPCEAGNEVRIAEIY